MAIKEPKFSSFLRSFFYTQKLFLMLPFEKIMGVGELWKPFYLSGPVTVRASGCCSHLPSSPCTHYPSGREAEKTKTISFYKASTCRRALVTILFLAWNNHLRCWGGEDEGGAGIDQKFYSHSRCFSAVGTLPNVLAAGCTKKS